MLQQENNEIILCCGKGKGCPRLKKVPQDKVQITDDDGNQVVLDTTQARLIAQALDQLDE
jgi:hypothetical protein